MRRPKASDRARLATVFGGVDGWVFDLDDTLYPLETGLFAAISGRIRAYVARLLGIGPDEALAVQVDYYRRYGTTLAGLVAERAVDVDDFLVDVHDIDRSVVPPDPRLAAALGRLPGQKFVFTSGSLDHAEKTLARLGIAAAFSGIFDVVDAALVPKSRPETYAAFFARTGLRPATSAMFEDTLRNLAVPRTLGMRTVLVVPKTVPPDGDAAPPVDFVADDLAGFLEAVADALGA